jgi:hypothetical protein
VGETLQDAFRKQIYLLQNFVLCCTDIERRWLWFFKHKRYLFLGPFRKVAKNGYELRHVGQSVCLLA